MRFRAKALLAVATKATLAYFLRSARKAVILYANFFHYHKNKKGWKLLLFLLRVFPKGKGEGLKQALLVAAVLLAKFFQGKKRTIGLYIV